MPFDPAKYSRQEQGFDPARYSTESGDTMTLESLMGGVPQGGILPEVLPDEVIPFTGGVQPTIAPTEEIGHPLQPLFDAMGWIKEKADIGIPGTETEVLGREFPGETRRRLFEPIPNPQSDPIISITNALKGFLGLTPDIPEFLLKDLPEAVAGTFTSEDRLKMEDPTLGRVGKEMGRSTIDVMALAVMRQLHPEEYRRFIKTERGAAIREMEAERLHEPALLPLILFGATGKAAKLAGKIGKGRRAIGGIAREPIVEEMLGAEKAEIAPAEVSAAAFEREFGLTEQLAKSPREAELLKRRLKAGKTLIEPEKVSEALPIENPYLRMPIERIRKDATQGVKLAKEALEQRVEKAPIAREPVVEAPKGEITRFADTAKNEFVQRDRKWYRVLTDAEGKQTYELVTDGKKRAYLQRISKPVEPKAPSPRGVKAKVKVERIRDDLPEAKPIIKEIDQIVAVAHKRMVEAKDPAIRGLRPTEMDWMTEAELARVHELQLKIRSKTQGESKADVSRKRAERLAKPAAKEPWEMTRTEFADKQGTYSLERLERINVGDEGRLSLTDKKGYEWSVYTDANPQLRTNPKTITIYRATEGKEFNPGDWVYLRHDMAKRHQVDRPKSKILTKKVPIDDIVKGPDANEFIWSPRSAKELTHREYIQQALSENKPVPAEVLKDYPELGKTTKRTWGDFLKEKPSEYEKAIVKKQLERGEFVPDEILDRHPDLAKPKAPAPMGAKAGINERWLLYEKTTDKPTNAGYMTFINRMTREYKASKKIADLHPIIDHVDFTKFITEKVSKPVSERGAVLNIPKEIARPAGSEPVPYKEAIKVSERPEMASIETYYKSISAPKKLTPAEAQKAGIALRKTKGGKIVPAVRRAGTFVPEDFAVYKNFKDAKQGIGGGTKDPIRYIQEIDGALSAQAKAKLPGQAGPAEKYILRRTEDMVKLKLKWSGEQAIRGREIVKGLSRKQDKLVTQVLEETSRPGAYVETADFATNPRIRKITTDQKVVKVAQESRKLLEYWLKEQNRMRELRGQPLIPHREYYAPHKLKEATLWSRRFGLKKEAIEIIERPQLPDYIKPDKPFNPRELAREAEMPNYMREMRISRLLEDYGDTAARDIFHTSIIQNGKAFVQQLETMGYKNAARGIGNWMAEGFGGIKGAGDRFIDLPRFVRKGMRVWRTGLVKSVFPLNWVWNTTVQTLSSGLTVMRGGAVNSTRGLYDWFGNKALRKQIADNAYSAIIKAQKAGRITQQDINIGMTKAVKLRRSKFQTAIDAANYFTELVERHITGWSIATGLRQGAKRGLKGKALWDYASDMGAKTQSMYNLENLPGMLRSEMIKTGAPFQTFRFEMYNTMKEFMGKTGTPPAAITERIGWVLRFTGMIIAGNEMAHSISGRKPWDVYSFFPFSDYWMKPMVAALRGKEYQTITRGLPSPVGASVEFARALKSFLKTGNTAKMRKWSIRYLPGLFGVPGGTQMSRTVDGIIAVADGGMEDSSDRMIFPITETKEQIRAVTMGPWRTKAGIEYWDKRETGILEDIGIVKPKKKALSPWEVMGGVGKRKKAKKGVDFSKYLGAE